VGLLFPVHALLRHKIFDSWDQPLPKLTERNNWIPTSCVSMALDGSSYLNRHFFAQIGERQPTEEDMIHPAYEWDEQAVQSTNQRMEGLAINALLVQLY